MSFATITALYRYPLKGFSAERLTNVHLKPGEEMPFDRAFAIENGPSGFDPEQPTTLPKIRFLMLMRNEKIARFECRFEPSSGVLSVSGASGVCVSGSLYDSQGVKRIERWIAKTFADDLRGPPGILRAEGHTFSDVDARVLHLVNLASVRALEEKIGRPVDPMRFRANVVIDGAPPFAELDWPGRQLSAGETLLTVTERTQRCAATNVDPSTGERDLQVPRSLMDLYGHSDFGVYAKVERGGRLAAGNTLSPVDSLPGELPFQ
jgi:uncharacterized protein YcbX